jgi:hypothetical protein
MPSKRRNDDDDQRPAYGLREDAFNDRLRSEGPMTDEEREEYWGDDRLPYELRKPERYPDDPATWLADPCMTQTETALRLARALIVSGVAQATIRVTLAGNELTRREKPRFPVERFLVENLGFFQQRLRKNSWEGFYFLEHQEHRLALMDHDRMEGHLETKLRGGRRLIAFVSRGHTASTRSSGEIKWVRSVIGRAATWDAKPFDVLAVAVPRSAHFSKIVKAFRQVEGIRRLRLHLLTVDRHSSDVGGLIDLRSAT